MMSNIFDIHSLTGYQIRTLHILEQSELLLLHYGYSKVTIDDIANKCNLGKGTIYLHWKSKESLFYAVFLKVAAEITYKIVKAIESDSNTVLFENLMVESYTACLERDLILALFTADSKLLGKLLKNKTSVLSQNIKSDLIRKNLEMYRKHNYIKDNMSIELQLHTISMLLLGMFNYNSYQGDRLSLNDQVLMLKNIIKSSLATEKSSDVNQELYEHIYSQFLGMLNFYKNQVFESTLKKTT